jgi:hypothetical protein
MQKKEFSPLSHFKSEDTIISNSINSKLKIGDVFTPILWAQFAIDKFGIFEKWIEGAKVFDPTMGEGNLLEALIDSGLKKGYTVSSLPIANLFGNELNTDYYNIAIEKFKSKYNINLSSHLSNADILDLEADRFDIIFGNPPWQNFVDLPEEYKPALKSHFHEYDLIEDSQSLLLGGSRIDIAALIIQKTISDFLKENGDAYFFMPLSLLLNDGANKSFRNYKIKETVFKVEVIYDFNKEKVFPGIMTRYGLVHFNRNQTTTFPIDYLILEKNEWIKKYAKPVFNENDPLSIYEKKEESNLDSFELIELKKESMPRQGINTCGANDTFFFNSYKEINSDLCEVSTSLEKGIILPKEFVYPLLTTKQFKLESNAPNKWVLLPFSKNGKALGENEVRLFPSLQEYLNSKRVQLENRKGVMLSAFIKRGVWWSLLGVGAYNFYPYKIVWEAYGKTSFEPKIFSGRWQANQSLQAYIPLKTIEDANQILEKLKDSRIQDYLISLKMEGTMNWAQPGKIKKFIKTIEESPTLF